MGGQFLADPGQGDGHDARVQEYDTRAEDRRDQRPGLVRQGGAPGSQNSAESERALAIPDNA